MSYQVIGFWLLSCLSVTDVLAQKDRLKSIEWAISGVLPSYNGTSRGLSGMIAGVHNDVLIAGGGCNFPGRMPWQGGRKKYYDALYVFKIDAHDSLLLMKTFKLPQAWAYAASCSTGDGIVAVGGENEQGLCNKTLLIQWNKATEAVNIKELPELPFAVTNAAVVVRGKKVYLAGGEMVDAVSDQFLYLDLDNPNAGWKKLPALPQPVSHVVMAVQHNGKNDGIYLLGGRKKNTGKTSDWYASVSRFDLQTNRWTSKNPMPYALSAGTGCPVGKNEIVLLGGDTGETFHKTEELIIAIDQEIDDNKKKQLNEQKMKVQSQHPGFSRQVLLYDTQQDRWKMIGSIPYDVPVTTPAVRWHNSIIIPGGEIRAGVRTPHILSAKMIF